MIGFSGPALGTIDDPPGSGTGSGIGSNGSQESALLTPLGDNGFDTLDVTQYQGVDTDGNPIPPQNTDPNKYVIFGSSANAGQEGGGGPWLGGGDGAPGALDQYGNALDQGLLWRIISAKSPPVYKDVLLVTLSITLTPSAGITATGPFKCFAIMQGFNENASPPAEELIIGDDATFQGGDSDAITLSVTGPINYAASIYVFSEAATAGGGLSWEFAFNAGAGPDGDGGPAPPPVEGFSPGYVASLIPYQGVWVSLTAQITGYTGEVAPGTNLGIGQTATSSISENLGNSGYFWPLDPNGGDACYGYQYPESYPGETGAAYALSVIGLAFGFPASGTIGPDGTPEEPYASCESGGVILLNADDTVPQQLDQYDAWGVPAEPGDL